MQDLMVFNDFILKFQISVAWGDMDALGHVNSSKYFVYFEQARFKYYETLGLLEYFEENKVAGVLAKTECSYLVPLKYPDILTVGVRVANLYEDYLIMEYYIKSELNGLSAFEDSDIVFYNFAANKKIFLPSIIVDKIIKFEKDKLNSY
jgi:acyl-CoA thioester hydrolase